MKNKVIAVGICALMLLVVFSSGCIDFGGEKKEKDTTPPTISGVTVSSITSSGATITWTTNEKSSSFVEYGSYGSIATGAYGVTSHLVTLSGLSAGTTYHYRVESTDSSGNTATSNDYTFTTLPEKIRINGNAGFTPVNGVTDGSGREADPYIIENLDIDASTGDGIEIRQTDAYFIIKNSVVHGGKLNSHNGIHFSCVINGKIENVTSYNNYYGILLDSISSGNQILNCTVHDDVSGIELRFSSNNKITNCVIYNNNYGITLWNNSFRNQITSCDVYNNYRGIGLWKFSENNQITNCTVHNNDNGVLLGDDSSDNQIYHNNFMSNPDQAYDACTNFWDNGSEGNYWDDYIGSDANGDGIGDTPYDIYGGDNQDRYPLMSPL